MGIVRTDESTRKEIEEFRRMVLSCAAVHGRKDSDGTHDRRWAVGDRNGDDAPEQGLVCVTSGVSYLGIAIVNQLLRRGYPVRIMVDNQEDVERLTEMEESGEMGGNNDMIGVVTAKLNDVESLREAFSGCLGVFHTASFIDPAGVSGYSKTMAEIEVQATENVVVTCATTPSLRYCVLTSSLVACIWRDNSTDSLSPVIDHDCWSDEALCEDKKLWFALGKLKAEKAARIIAEEMGLKLVTMCPGLVTGPDFFRGSPTSTIAYLKGAQEMYTKCVLATVDVNRLAEAHVRVFKEMKNSASGRYICFDRVVQSMDEVQRLAQETGISVDVESSSSSARFELSNRKLTQLISPTRRCTYEN